ncbi:MAG TPA: MBL fold metallo-hydrolase [Spirochaetota bacterium]|nr:MBL fold metallo-hydrolase [Spirochaetota bacterium]
MNIQELENNKLQLTNKGNLSLFFIGVGSAFSKKHNQTNLLIIKGEDHLLIDCGTKCRQALYDYGTSLANIKNYLITHSHADHIGSLEEAALMGRYVAKKKPRIVITEAYEHILWDMSLRGGSAFGEETMGQMLTFEAFFEIVRPKYLTLYPRETFEAYIGGINIKMVRTMHIPDKSLSEADSFWSCGVIIDDRILFTGDTRFDFDLIDYYDKEFNFEAIFHDCQLYTGGVHSSIEELNTFPKEIKKKMYLVHYGDNWEDFIEKAKSYGFAGFGRQGVYYNF